MMSIMLFTILVPIELEKKFNISKESMNYRND